MKFAEFERQARARLQQELPGTAAQLRMAPRPRRGWTPGEVPDDSREGAGLILVYPREEQACLVLTVRHDELPQHAGQISLPGGAVEPGETIRAAALREAHEEIGIEPGAVRVLGTLTPLHIPVSGFALHPVLGVLDEIPALSPQVGEVDRVLEVPLAELADSRLHRFARRTHEGVDYDVPFIRAQGENVWGATAMILAELLWLIGHPPSVFDDDEDA